MRSVNPRSYDKQVDDKIEALRSKLSSDISLEESDALQKQQDIQRKYNNEISSLDARMKDQSNPFKIALLISVAVFVVVFFGSCGTIFADHESERQFAESLGIALTRDGQYVEFGLWVWFGVPGASFILSFILTVVLQSARDNGLAKRIQQAQEARESELQDVANVTQSKIDQLERAAEQEVSNLQLEKQKHRAEYEKQRRQDSVRYANSPIAGEIAEMLLNGFKKQIDNSDRRPHVQEVIVPFSFKVLKTGVETPYGDYDFELKRVAKLKIFDEQAALANAIAQKVHTEIVMSYPEDVSGGEVSPMAIDIDYGSNWVEASMVYRASNANYIPERSF